MEAIRLYKTVEKDGELTVTGLPFRRGARVEMILMPETGTERPPLTMRALLASGLIGIWKDRDDIGDSVTFARQLRERAQKRI